MAANILISDGGVERQGYSGQFSFHVEEGLRCCQIKECCRRTGPCHGPLALVWNHGQHLHIVRNPHALVVFGDEGPQLQRIAFADLKGFGGCGVDGDARRGTGGV